MIANQDSNVATQSSLLSKAALLIIDMQNGATDIVPPARTIIPTTKRVLDAWRAVPLPVIFKTRVHRPDGIDVERFRLGLFEEKPFLVEGSSEAEIFPELKPRRNEYVVKGARFSGFFQTDLQLVLTRLGVGTVVVCGIQTPNCVRATVTDALAYDYHVILLQDAVTAQTAAVHEANLFDMRNMGVSVIPSSELLARLS